MTVIDIFVPIDNLTQERYRFYVHLDWERLTATLDVYEFQKRATPRHKFVAISKYSRDDRRNTMDITNLVIPEKVAQEVKDKIMAMLVITTK